ncbi:MAG: fumarylacetoacetate hydrolase family protein [Chloroflexota bacterium]
MALGVHYHDHREEAGSDKHAEETLFFRKDDSSINTPTGDIVRPGREPLLDYEVEMGLVIKKAITAPLEMTQNNIGDYVAGMVLVNDMSARVTMIGAPFSQWYRGKSGRTMCPVGPYIYIFEEGEAAKMHAMQIKLWVNDELRQDAHTRDLIAKPETAFTKASRFVDLAPGDLLLTGTPGGVAIKAPSDLVMFISQFIPAKRRIKMLIDGQLKSGKFLNDGDVVRCTLRSADGAIDCGEQRNRVVAPR